MTANIIRCKNPWFIFTKCRPPPTCACSSLYNCHYRSSLFDTRRQTITSVSITVMIIIVICRYVLYGGFMQLISLADSQRTVVMYETFRSFLHFIIRIFQPFGDHLRHTYRHRKQLSCFDFHHKCVQISRFWRFFLYLLDYYYVYVFLFLTLLVSKNDIL